jgi:ribosomal protein S18 acetylase RimI-like enzyme
MKIRKIEWKDFHDLIDAYYSYYDEVVTNPTIGLTLYSSKPTLASETEWFSNLYRRVLEGDSVVYVAEEDGRAVGLCQVDRRGPQEEQRHRGGFGIAIRKEYRDRGIGTALISKVLEDCKGKFEIVELTVFSNNARAKHLYSKHGFKITGHNPKAVKRGSKYYDEDYMALELG